MKYEHTIKNVCVKRLIEKFPIIHYYINDKCSVPPAIETWSPFYFNGDTQKGVKMVTEGNDIINLGLSMY